MPPADPPPKATAPRISLQFGHEIGHRLELRSSGNDDDFIFARQPRNRRRHVERDRRLVGEQRPQHDEAVDHQDIAVALFLVDQLGEPDGAAGARNVLNRAALGAQAGHDFRKGARRLVPAAAGFCRGDDPQIVKGQCRSGKASRQRQGQKACKNCASFHDHLPFVSCAIFWYSPETSPPGWRVQVILGHGRVKFCGLSIIEVRACSGVTALEPAARDEAAGRR